MLKKTVNKIDLNHFEKVIIQQALKNEHYLSSIIEHLQPEYFKDPHIKAIIQIIAQYYQKRGTIPNFTEIKTYLTTDELKLSCVKVVDYIKALDVHLNEHELYQNTETFLKQKGIYYRMMVTMEKTDIEMVDPANLLFDMEKVCNISLDTNVGLDLFGDFQLVKEDILKEEQYISSGWKWMDEQLGGGFLKCGKSLVVFAGETNIGKSIVLGNVADNIASQGHSVLLVTLEMSEKVYARRIAAKISQISFNDMKSNIDEVTSKIEQYKKNNLDSQIIIKEFPPSVVKPLELSGYIKKLRQKGVKIDAIVLDYINLLTSNNGSNSYEKVKYIAEQIRALTYTFECPIITATQFNRSAAGSKDPGMEKVSESYGLCQTADVLITIWRDEDTDIEDDRIRMTFAKNRQGRRESTQSFKVAYETMTITQEDEETNEPKNIADTIKGLGMFEETKDILETTKTINVQNVERDAEQN